MVRYLVAGDCHGKIFTCKGLLCLCWKYILLQWIAIIIYLPARDIHGGYLAAMDCHGKIKPARD